MDDIAALKQQLVDRVQALQQQGIVDNYFWICHSLKEDNGQYFFLELLPMFLNDVRTVIRGMTMVLDQSDVDFDAMYDHGIKLKGSSACIGACRIARACSDLCQATEKKSKDVCLLALNDVKQQYNDLNSQLECIIELEREIVAMENGDC